MKTQSSKTRLLILVFGLGLLGAASAFAQKTDLVHLHNGDRVTAEIKELVRGQMHLSTDPFGTIYVKWEDVERIESNKRLQVELADGTRYYGVLEETGESGALALKVRGEIVNLDLTEIVYIQPFKESQRFDGNLDAKVSVGLSYTRASDIARWNVNASTSYRAEKYLASASYDSLITNNGQGKDAVSRDLTVGYSRFRKNNWTLFTSGSYQQNDELGVDGRFIARGGVGKIVSQSRSYDLLLGAGIAGNFEAAVGSSTIGSDDSASAEGLLIAEWAYFKLYTPKSDIKVTAELYPSLSESERWRGNLRVRFRQELIKKLFWNVNYYYNFDTDPPEGALSERDYGLVTGLEYTF